MTRETKRAALIVCAVGLVAGAFTREWFTSPLLSAGLWGIEVCEHGCHGTRWDDVNGAQEELYLAGYLAFALSLVGAVLLAMIAFDHERWVKPARKVLLVAAAAMGYFVLRAYALDGLSGVGPSFALPIGLAAAIGGHFALRERA
jgi:hypothetical protein